jgi:hypothetical protein
MIGVALLVALQLLLVSLVLIVLEIHRLQF